MRIHYFVYDDVIVIFSVPTSLSIDIESMRVIASQLGKEISIKISLPLTSDSLDQDTKDNIRKKAKENHGHGLISPIVIPRQFNGVDNVDSVKRMLKEMKSDGHARFSVERIDIGEVDSIGFTITTYE